jgi:hypothetical protein
LSNFLKHTLFFADFVYCPINLFFSTLKKLNILFWRVFTWCLLRKHPCVHFTPGNVRNNPIKIYCYHIMWYFESKNIADQSLQPMWKFNRTKKQHKILIWFWIVVDAWTKWYQAVLFFNILKARWHSELGSWNT